LFSDSLDGAVPSDTGHLLLPKLEHIHVSEYASSVDTHSHEQTDCSVYSTDNLLSITVKLPLIARLRRVKTETSVACVKMEDADATEDSAAVQSGVAVSQTAEEVGTDIKKETSAAAKSLQLARETIASIFGTEFQPPSMMKIPIKRRTEQDSDERGASDAKRSRSSSQNDNMHNNSYNRPHHWYVSDYLCYHIAVVKQRN